MKMKLGFLAVIVLTSLAVSCATGEYMPMQASEQSAVIGNVQSTFLVTGAFRYRSTINREAYITLMAEAQKKYPDQNVDIRDISWVIGQGDAANNNYEYIAIGKVIKE
ncbi:MAG: hypothetical protein FWF22_01515 [Treponema sp.]|nr:hypothetical protein [Treponema sp.]